MSIDRLLEAWFLQNRRSFPWRIDKDPYRVWISEVMLQQTRAAVVVPYFERWVQLFPDVKALYMASLEQVIKAWEGLGYYSRARNLHAAAKEIVERFDGKIPSSYEDLMSIRGFGPYTAAAVLNFGFHQRAVAVDGNVLRVISRYFSIEERVDRTITRRLIEKKVDSLLGIHRPWVVSEALIELGATVCLPKPRCELCPLRDSCAALKKGNAELLPIKKIKETQIFLFRVVLLFENEGNILVQKRGKKEIMADLYEFPYVEVDHFSIGISKICELAQTLTQESFVFQKKLSTVSHTFTRYKAHLLGCLFKMKRQVEIPLLEWVSIEKLPSLPFSSGHRKIREEVEKIGLYR